MYLRFKEETTSSGINGYISGLNVWNHVLESQEIWRMSLGCANETGNAEAWTRSQYYLSYNSTQCSVIRIKKALSCQDREGSFQSQFIFAKTVKNMPVNLIIITSA